MWNKTSMLTSKLIQHSTGILARTFLPKETNRHPNYKEGKQTVMVYN